MKNNEASVELMSHISHCNDPVFNLISIIQGTSITEHPYKSRFLMCKHATTREQRNTTPRAI
jgi:hypothetical protein